jgi:NAD(P)H-dependent FMN reductase
MKILALSGSLRENSSNSTLLNILKSLDPVGIQIYAGIGSLPFFSPERDEGDISPEVIDLRNQLQSCDGVILSTPEYAFGMPGVLKNALDWLVSSGSLYQKPTVALSASPSMGGGDKALTNLFQVLEAQGAKVLLNLSQPFPKIYKRIAKDGTVLDPSLNIELQEKLKHMQAEIESKNQ